MIIRKFPKQAEQVEIYDIDFAQEYLAGVDDTAGNLLAFAAESGIDVESQVTIGDPVPGGVLKVRAEGGTVGEGYTVTALMATADGREVPASILIQVVA